MEILSKKTASKVLFVFFAFLILCAGPLEAFAQPAGSTDPVSTPTPAPTGGDDATPGVAADVGGTTAGALAAGAAARARCLSIPNRAAQLACLTAAVAAGGYVGHTVVAPMVQCSFEGDGALSCLINGVAYIILQFANLLLGVAGTLFNWTMMKTVFQFSAYLGNSPGLLIAWSILRDIGNMVLLFGFIFIGLATILDLQTYAAKKALPRLIIFAILMNFSLFAAEAVIDTSNVLSTVMYRQASPEECAYDAPVTSAPADAASPANTPGSTGNFATDDAARNCFLNSGIAGRIVQTTGVDSMFDASGGQNTYQNAVLLIMLAIFATVASIVLFAATIMLVFRAVTLVFLMVLAPLGFAGMAIPPLREMGEKWWNKLIHQSFFAPILLLLMLVSLKIGEGFASADTRGSLAAGILQADPSATGIILIFCLMIGFLIASLIAAKNFGAMGANFAIKTASGITAGTMGFAGRRTVGRAAAAGAAGIRKTKFGQSEMGRMFAGGLDRGAKASFDFRSTKLGGIASKQGLDIGKGQTGGYKKIVDDGVKARTEYAKSLKQTRKDKEKEKELNNEKEQIGEDKKQEAENWKDYKAGKEKEIADKNAAASSAAAARTEARKEQEAKLELARGEGGSPAQARREEQALQDLVKAHEAEAKRESDDIKTLQETLSGQQTEHDENMKRFEDRIEEIDLQIDGGVDKKTGRVIVGVGANSAKQRYAANLERGVTPRGLRNIIRPGGFTPLTARGATQEGAYNAIVKDLKKTKGERIADEIKEAIKDTGKDIHDIDEKVDAALDAADKK